MAFFFGEEAATIGDNQAEVAGAGLIHAGKIDLVENAMTQREINSAVEVQRGADPGLSTRSPARRDSGPSRRITKVIAIAITITIAHSPIVLTVQAVCQKMRIRAGSFIET
jgi:hypothetical protein